MNKRDLKFLVWCIKWQQQHGKFDPNNMPGYYDDGIRLFQGIYDELGLWDIADTDKGEGKNEG